MEPVIVPEEAVEVDISPEETIEVQPQEVVE